eukprot:CAMPEP_0198450016 /NCGR_PEP_ID=MMETSP1453-20131121/4731_1 /TAXON_ID=1461543 ORGANISM="Unidentified sp., Strain RCC701" /NCGR_SAMPLE_ID=MMETSP1453 /ASSEMBLY_ACC=CAM_ASM_001118 /LENGTH=88 /DNA_ID=CAMNT_0044172969 /DNA_START=14 /DNA_END=277 /DNA_ORIENTATION=-
MVQRVHHDQAKQLSFPVRAADQILQFRDELARVSRRTASAHVVVAKKSTNLVHGAGTLQKLLQSVAVALRHCSLPPVLEDDVHCREKV